MLDFLYNYAWIIILVILAAVYFYWVYKEKGKAKMLEELRLKIYKLMILAEKKYGPNTGKQKFNWVADKVYLIIPPSLKLFVSKDDLRYFIQECYLEIKD